MFSQNVAIKTAGMDSQLLSHDEAETSSVKVCATADDSVLGKSTQLPCYIGHDVHYKDKEYVLNITCAQISSL